MVMERMMSVLRHCLLAVVYSREQQWDGFGNGEALKSVEVVLSTGGLKLSKTKN